MVSTHPAALTGCGLLDSVNLKLWRLTPEGRTDSGRSLSADQRDQSFNGRRAADHSAALFVVCRACL